jgi:hypothetical protein
MDRIKCAGKFTPVAGGAFFRIFGDGFLFGLIPANHIDKTSAVAFFTAYTFTFIDDNCVHFKPSLTISKNHFQLYFTLMRIETPFPLAAYKWLFIQVGSRLQNILAKLWTGSKSAGKNSQVDRLMSFHIKRDI